MRKIGIIYGSDTGVTEEITELLVDQLRDEDVEIIEVFNAQLTDFRKFDLLILGLSTWYDGELQSDWDNFFENFKTIDFKDQIVALYGVGDQYGYGEYFVDGVGILAEVILERGGIIIGNWPTEGYDFIESKAQKDESTFYGLAIDEDNQSELTKSRIEAWANQVKFESKDILFAKTI
ncbi:MAG: flavodoxin [Bacteroidota bacterium]